MYGTGYYDGAYLYMYNAKDIVLPNVPRTLLPYDGTTLVGAIGSTPVVVDGSGNISVPSYALAESALAGSQELAASGAHCTSSAGCTSSYGGGSGAGTGGYVLTVQQAAGNAIQVGQTLYGGAGLAAGTTITQQISDADGKLCGSSQDSCNGGGAGVYLVNSSQLVAPGTPMSASDGSGLVIGFADGQVWSYDLDTDALTQLQGAVWNSAVNTIIPWRDGFVAGLNNGCLMYWSPSNNPNGNNNNNPNALTYAGSTVATSVHQTSGWSQLTGTDYGMAVTSMVQMGDSIAVGLTAPGESTNGMVQIVTGFGSVATDAAFGYQSSSLDILGSEVPTGPVALPAPSYTITQIASQNALSANNGSIQQLIVVPQYTTDSLGHVVLGSSLVAGQTNNAIWTWAGSNQHPTASSWTDIQEPGDGEFDEKVLKDAWTYGLKATGDWGTEGAVGATGDPVFGIPTNQAWCGTNCSSNGDYYAFSFHHPFGTDGVIYSLGTDAKAELDLSAMGYGYVFVPNGVIDKFRPDYYSVGLVVAAQGGPSVYLHTPKDDTSISEKVDVTGIQFSDTKETEFGTFGVNVGIDLSVDANAELKGALQKPLELAHAFYTPGMLYTWNTNGSGESMALDFSSFSSIDYVTEDKLEQYFEPSVDANASVTATPYAQLSYGLYTPKSWPSLDIFKLSVGYQNPISATVTVDMPAADSGDDPSSSLTLTSQGFITADAQFLPTLTSSLSWKDKYQLYNVTI